jgi:glycerol-3-phosphate responsive antiterminator
MATKKKEEPKGIVLPLVAGVVAGIAGSYFLYGQGKPSPANKKKIKGWIIKAKGEALEKIEKLKSVDEESYHKVIDTIAEKYAKVKDIDPNEVQELVKDLKKHWKNLVRDVQPKKKKKPTPKAKAPASAPTGSAT